MAVGVPRDELIKKINELFGPGGIAGSASRTKRNKDLGPDADVFDILHALGAFPWVKGKSVDEIVGLLAGNKCGPRPTSCADQMTIALRRAQSSVRNQ